MIKKLRVWYNKQLEQAKDRDYIQGYDWAAGRLLRGEEASNLTDYLDPCPTSKGVRDAVEDFNKQLRTRRGDGVAHYNSIKPVISKPEPWKGREQL